jgi:hypothetical protein
MYFFVIMYTHAVLEQSGSESVGPLRLGLRDSGGGGGGGMYSEESSVYAWWPRNEHTGCSFRGRRAHAGDGRAHKGPGYKQAAMAACTCDSRLRMHGGHEVST